MYMLEIFFKRKKFIPLFASVWQPLGKQLDMPADVDDQGQQRNLMYFAAVLYAAVYQVALAVDMSTSSAHYLARIQLKKSKLDPLLVKYTENLFSAPEGEAQGQFVQSAKISLQAIVEGLQTVDAAMPPQQIAEQMKSLRQQVETLPMLALS